MKNLQKSESPCGFIELIEKGFTAWKKSANSLDREPFPSHVLAAAEAMKAGIEVTAGNGEAQVSDQNLGTVIIGTIEGDILHRKDIVASMLNIVVSRLWILEETLH